MRLTDMQVQTLQYVGENGVGVVEFVEALSLSGMAWPLRKFLEQNGLTEVDSNNRIILTPRGRRHINLKRGEAR